VKNFKYLFIGHSHTQCIYDASIKKSEVINWGFMDPIEGNGPIRMLDGSPYLLPIIKDNIFKKIQESNSIISTIGGNAHNFYGLIEPPSPFDFDSPGINTPRRPDIQYIPYNIIKNSFAKKLYNGDISMLQAIMNEGINIRCHIESPPPIMDNCIILGLLDDHFRCNYPNAKIADPFFRLKFWKLQSTIYEEFCIRNNITYIKSPDLARDKGGFLKEEYLSKKSSTHANSDYGSLILNQLEDIL
jgi:hypothetical protein